MEESLLQICITAFIAVFLLLSLLSLSMKIITALFPPEKSKTGAALVAAVTTAVSGAFPGSSVSNMEEIK